jgi:CheY-like chemotaxis protein
MQNVKPILLVDDDDIDVMTVERVFGDLEVPNQLVCRFDGEEALEYLRNPGNEKPCLIFLDLNMPRMNGWELLEVIVADNVLRDIPVVILTTSARELDKQKAEKYRPTFIGYINKPSKYQEFVELIKRQLEEHSFIHLENAVK